MTIVPHLLGQSVTYYANEVIETQNVVSIEYVKLTKFLLRTVYLDKCRIFNVINTHIGSHNF